MTFDYRTPFYDRYVGSHQGVLPEQRNRARMATDVLRHLPPSRSVDILDVGCGQGMLMRFLLDKGYDSVTGIDLSADQIALARKLGTPNVREGDLFELSAQHAQCYDAVVALDVIEHFDRADVPRLFAAFAALLRPGGILILRTPNGSSPYSGRYQFSDLTHGVIYTNRSLEQVAAVTGFTQVRVFPVRPAGPSVPQRVRRALWAVVEKLIVAPLIIETGQVRGHIVTQNLVCTATRA